MFVVLSAATLPSHLRGYISRFLVRVDVGLFVGKTSRKVADQIWEDCLKACGNGSLVMINSDSSVEQGFSIRAHGTRYHHPFDYDGLSLTLWDTCAETQNSQP